MSRHKEPRFFCNFGDRAWSGPGGQAFARGLVTSPADYEALFEDAGAARWRGEASTDYLWVPEAPARIAAACGDAKIVVVLRNPVDRAFSEHSHLVREGHEPQSFLRSLELEDERFGADWQPLFYHRRRGVYAAALERYRRTFGAEQLHVIPYASLQSDPDRVAAHLFEFLKIDQIAVSTTTVYNRSGRPRSAWLHQTVKRDTLAKRAIRLVLGRSRARALRARAEAVNLKPLRLTDEERRTASALFEEDVAQTRDALGGVCPPALAA